MKKILMVCLGNICRSPLAEGIMKDLVDKKDLKWEVDSAGTAGYHVGELPDTRSIEVAKRNGIDITSQRSRKLNKEDIKYYDHLLVMDASNYQNTLELCEEEVDASKVEMILNYSHPGQNRQVPDPYYEGGFDKVYSLLYEACTSFIQAHSK